MIRFFFNVCYAFLLLIFLPFLLYAACFKGKYREGFGEKFLGNAPRLPKAATRRVWVHAVSVGEVNLAASILKEFERRHPDFEFVLSTTSKTGMELARKKFPNRTVFYAPLDFSWAVSRALRRIQPDFLVLVELELWPNLLLTAQKRSVPVIVMNGRLGEKSFRNYSRVRPLLRPILRSLSLVTTQDETGADHFRTLGTRPERVINVGSIKYDGAQSDRQNEKTRRLAALWEIRPEDRIFLAGSTQDPEEAMAVEVFRRLRPEHPELRLILVPRHPERFSDVARLLEKSEFSFCRRSEITAPEPAPTSASTSASTSDSTSASDSAPDSASTHREPILLVDTIGELGGWWGTSSVGFVGGSMGTRGGQNMLEPAAFGTPVSFGPNTWNFRDIVSALLTHDAAVVVRDTEELTDFVRRCLEDAAYAQTLGSNAAALVASQQGALRKTLDLFDQFHETNFEQKS